MRRSGVRFPEAAPPFALVSGRFRQRAPFAPGPSSEMPPGCPRPVRPRPKGCGRSGARRGPSSSPPTRAPAPAGPPSDRRRRRARPTPRCAADHVPAARPPDRRLPAQPTDRFQFVSRSGPPSGAGTASPGLLADAPPIHDRHEQPAPGEPCGHACSSTCRRTTPRRRCWPAPPGAAAGPARAPSPDLRPEGRPTHPIATLEREYVHQFPVAATGKLLPAPPPRQGRGTVPSRRARPPVGASPPPRRSPLRARPPPRRRATIARWRERPRDRGAGQATSQQVTQPGRHVSGRDRGDRPSPEPGCDVVPPDALGHSPGSGA